MKVYVVTGYDSIFDTVEIKGIFSTKEKAKQWYTDNNYSKDTEPLEFEVED